MKYLAVLFIFCLLGFASIPIRAQEHFSKNKATDMLISFYTEYITEQSKEPTPENYQNIAALQKKYCSAGLIRKIKKQQAKNELSYDPFLNAQDCDSGSLETLVVKSDPQVINGFIVSYSDTYSGDRIMIRLVVRKDKGNYKIASII